MKRCKPNILNYTAKDFEALQAILLKVAEWANRVPEEQVTEFVVEVTRGLMDADEQAMARYKQELDKRGVPEDERAELIQTRYSQLHDDRQREGDDPIAVDSRAHPLTAGAAAPEEPGDHL